MEPRETRKTLLKSKLARRLFIQFVLCALLPLGAVAMLSYGHVSRELIRQARERLHASTRASGSTLSERLQSLEKDLLDLREKLRQGEDFLESTGEAPEEWLSSRFHSLALVRKNGEFFARLGPLSERPLLDPEELAHLRAGNTLVATRPVPDSFVGVFVLLLVEPAEAGSDLLIAEVRSDFLWESDAHATSAEEFFAVDESLGLLFTTLPHGSPVSELMSALERDSASGSFEWELDGEEFVASYRTVFLQPRFLVNWTIAQSAPTAEVVGAANYFRRVLVLVTMLTFWVVVLLSIRRIRKSLEPLDQLREATRRLAAKDLDHRVNIKSGDELQELGEAFNVMASKVQARTHELEDANRTKNEFLANMSHEIRTPMTAILGYADLSQSPDLSSADLQQYLGIIMGNGEHLLALINDILDVSKIEAGKMQVESLVCSPEELIADVFGLMEVSAQSKGLELVVENTGPIPQAILTDPTRLRQILINLLGNSIKFTEEGGVSLRVFLTEDEAGGALLAFEVRDTGVGMNAEQMGRVFEPFTQADASTTRSYGGTGLGLSIVRALVRLLGGDIECTSEIGEGTTFLITIDPGPLEGIPQTEQISARRLGLQGEGGASQDSQAESRGRVLLAEDVPVNRRLIATILEQAGVEVEEAENGIEAYEKAMAAKEAGSPYGIIFMDMQMPEMDGYEAARRLRGEGYDAPIVALTSHTMVGERAKCLRAGCDEYATKPIDKETFLKITFRYLREPGGRRHYRLAQ